MKKTTLILLLLLLSFCSNRLLSKKGDWKNKKDCGKYEYEKVIVKPLIKSEDCGYITEGIIEYRKDGKVVATVDYGNGECDEWATKIWEGGSKKISLVKDKNYKEKKSKTK